MIRRGLGAILTVMMCLGTWAGAASAHGLGGQEAGSMVGPQLQAWGIVEQGLRAAPPLRDEPPLAASPRAGCGPGSRPEPGMQGRVPAGADPKGYRCNIEQIGHEGPTGGFKVERYVDKAGHECAYYDTTVTFLYNAVAVAAAGKPTGTAVLDMADPAHPVRTATLMTAAMQSPHESLVVNQKRGLLAAVMGSALTAPGIVDIYDVSADCRHPVLQSSSPIGILGHESGFSLDGNTFYSTSPGTFTVTAVDVSNPKLPSVLWLGPYDSHGMSLSADGKRAYLAGIFDGLIVLDTSQIQARMPNPEVPLVSRLTWKARTIPQNAMPMTIAGKPYLLEIDEFSQDGSGFISANGQRVGAGRIIDISDERQPRVISNLRLEVHQPENRAALAADPGAMNPGQGYAGHYCGIPQEVDPGIVACSFIASGLRVFDIRDPYQPKEIAYFVAPPAGLAGVLSIEKADWAMSRPSFVPERGEIWYSDINSGFYSLRMAKGVWPFEPRSSTLGLPTANACASRRNFTIHLRQPGGERLRSARVYVNGKRVKVVRGRRTTARIDLRGLPRGTVVVNVVATTHRGRTIRETRRYRTCAR